MRFRCGTVALVVALTACAASVARTSRNVRRGFCTPHGARILASDAQATVFESNQRVYGCSVATREIHRLGSAGNCVSSDRAGPVALNGVMAAYGLARCGVDTGTAQLVVRRLTDGTVLHDAPATSEVPGAETYQSVGSVVVKPDGAVAWIGVANSIIGRGTVIEVNRVDRRGKAELDHGRGIGANSLRLRGGSELSWTHSRQRRTATLD